MNNSAEAAKAALLKGQEAAKAGFAQAQSALANFQMPGRTPLDYWLWVGCMQCMHMRASSFPAKQTPQRVCCTWRTSHAGLFMHGCEHSGDERSLHWEIPSGNVQLAHGWRLGPLPCICSPADM